MTDDITAKKFRKGRAGKVDCIHNGKKVTQKSGSADAKY